MNTYLVRNVNTANNLFLFRILLYYDSHGLFYERDNTHHHDRYIDGDFFGEAAFVTRSSKFLFHRRPCWRAVVVIMIGTLAWPNVAVAVAFAAALVLLMMIRRRLDIVTAESKTTGPAVVGSTRDTRRPGPRSQSNTRRRNR